MPGSQALAASASSSLKPSGSIKLGGAPLELSERSSCAITASDEPAVAGVSSTGAARRALVPLASRVGLAAALGAADAGGAMGGEAQRSRRGARCRPAGGAAAEARLLMWARRLFGDACVAEAAALDSLESARERRAHT